MDRLAKLLDKRDLYVQQRNQLRVLKFVKVTQLEYLLLFVEKTYAFLDKFFNIAIPRTKDFSWY